MLPSYRVFLMVTASRFAEDLATSKSPTLSDLSCRRHPTTSSLTSETCRRVLQPLTYVQSRISSRPASSVRNARPSVISPSPAERRQQLRIPSGSDLRDFVVDASHSRQWLRAHRRLCLS